MKEDEKQQEYNFIYNLNKITQLGFKPSISWNDSFNIYLQIGGVEVLVVMYLYTENYPFLECIENTCDFFYGWYNTNKLLINKAEDAVYRKKFFDLKQIEKLLVGNITNQINTQINREFKIKKIMK